MQVSGQVTRFFPGISKKKIQNPILKEKIMPIVSNTNNMSSRVFLNNYIEELFIKDIKDNYDALIDVKKD
jgi:hypothetical protein